MDYCLIRLRRAGNILSILLILSKNLFPVSKILKFLISHGYQLFGIDFLIPINREQGVYGSGVQMIGGMGFHFVSFEPLNPYY